MDYKYTILNGTSRVYVGIGWRNRCLLATFFTVGLFAGIYFLVGKYSEGKFRPFKNQKLLLVSVDGFRYNLREKTDTPYIDWFVANGVSVGSVFPVFPTVTVPNHQSIATGLYPENHGILANKMFDKKTGKSFRMLTNSAEFWKDATPIWIENELQGHRSGNCFWPGYDVTFNGKQATYMPTANYSNPMHRDARNMPWEERVELVIKWLKQGDVNFATLYINEPDEIEHKVGPDPINEAGKEALNSVVKRIDATIGKIMKRLKEEKMDSHVNVLIIGDHGQTNTDRENKVIDWTKYVTLKEDAQSFGDCFIYAKPKQTKNIYKKLKQAQQEEGHFQVYLKEDIPNEYRIRNHRLTGDIMYLADPGWTIWLYGGLNRTLINPGTHGYSNKVKDMHSAFFAAGPAFRKNFKKELIHSVDVYALMCHILQIRPRTHDGDFDRIKSVLKEFS